MTRGDQPERDEKAAKRGRELLVVAPAGTDREGLYRELADRGDFILRFVASAAEGNRALHDLDLVLLIASPEVPTSDVTLLLVTKGRVRPDLPLLVIRNRQAEEPQTWSRRGVGVLRCPLLPTALSRSVDVVLGLAEARS